MRVQGFFFTLPDDVPFYENEEAYVRVKQSLVDYHSASSDLRQSFIDCSAYLVANPGSRVAPDAAEGDGEARLEVAIRRLSGCGGFLQDVNRALSALDTIIDPDHEDPSVDVSDALVAKAFSCKAFAFIEKYEAAVKNRNVRLANDHLYAAAIHADAAVSRGLVTPTALGVVSLLTRSAEQYKHDVRNSPRYRIFVSLWRAMDRRDEEMAAEDRKRAAKIAKAPNAYKCAAGGCGVEGTSKKALLRCSGKCPAEYKPSYCSKECQKTDWPVHKQICKPGSESKNSASAPATTGGPPIKVSMNDPSALDDEISSEVGGVERIIEFPHPGMPGGKLRIVSKHLSPAFLRYLKGSMSARGG
ncbi:hypothetical protein B0H11DRAFT_1952873 [Mycena galericulata]|nr:hypothetical protein B0H11DRAFT_1952873 [Mycena galericulata]